MAKLEVFSIIQTASVRILWELSTNGTQSNRSAGYCQSDTPSECKIRLDSAHAVEFLVLSLGFIALTNKHAKAAFPHGAQSMRHERPFIMGVPWSCTLDIGFTSSLLHYKSKACDMRQRAESGYMDALPDSSAACISS
jgi:hypothetical protein